MFKHIALSVGIALVLVGCGGGDGTPSVTAPSNVTTTGEFGFVTVSWAHDGNDVTGFRVQRIDKTADGVQLSANATFDLGSDARSYLDHGVLPGGAYEYTVAALRGSAASAATSTADAITVEEGVALGMGIYGGHPSGDARMFLAAFAFFERAPATELTRAYVTGPSGWNGNNPFLVANYEAGTVPNRLTTYSGASEPLPGEYTLQVIGEDSGDVYYEASASLASVEQPEPITLREWARHAESLVLDWDDVAGAKLYNVILWSGSPASTTFVSWTTSPISEVTIEHDFSLPRYGVTIGSRAYGNVDEVTGTEYVLPTDDFSVSSVMYFEPEFEE